VQNFLVYVGVNVTLHTGTTLDQRAKEQLAVGTFLQSWLDEEEEERSKLKSYK